VEHLSSGPPNPSLTWGRRLDEIPIDLMELTRERLAGGLPDEEYLRKELELLEEFDDLLDCLKSASAGQGAGVAGARS
jgi:hypothetical protein